MCGVLFVLLAALAAVADSQVFLAHRCQNVSVVQNFDVDKYLGLWYEYEKVNTTFEAGGICVKAEYSLRTDGKVGVHNTQVDSSTRELKEIFGSASLDSSTGEGKLKVTFPTEGIFRLGLRVLQTVASVVRPVPVTGNIAAPYWVLSTDYTSYSVVWSCVNLGTRSIQFAWVLTRDKSPGEAVLSAVHRVLDQNHLEDLPLHLTPQTCS